MIQEQPIPEAQVEAVLSAVLDRIRRKKSRCRKDPLRTATEALFKDNDPVLEAVEADALGGMYEALLGFRLTPGRGRLEVEEDPAGRRRSGAFFTPRHIAEYAVREALGPHLAKGKNPAELRVVDPAAGAGAFLMAAARSLGGNTAALTGVDCDSGALAAAGLALRRAFPHGGDPHLWTGDALLHGPEAPLESSSFDAVVGNPPFLNVKRGALRHVHAELCARYHTARGQYDSWSLFLELALTLLRSGGRYALVLPRPFLASESYAGIRRTLLTRSTLERVAELGTPFPDAHVEAVVVVGVKGTRSRRLRFHDLTRTPPSSRSAPASASFLALPNATISTECGTKEMNFLLETQRAPARLGDLVRIVRGIECGKRHPAVFERGAPGRMPLLRGDQVDSFRTTPAAFIDIGRVPESKLKPIPLFQRRPKLLVRRVAPTLKAAVDESGAFTLNTVYVLHPRDPAMAGDFYYCLSALLNSSLLGRYHRLAFAANDRLFPYVRISQLSMLPMPAVEALQGNAGAELAALARKAHTKPDFSIRAEVDPIVNRMFEAYANEKEIPG